MTKLGERTPTLQRALDACAAERKAKAAKVARMGRLLAKVLRALGAASELVNGQREGFITCSCGVVTRIGVVDGRVEVFTRRPHGGGCKATCLIARAVQDILHDQR